MREVKFRLFDFEENLMIYPTLHHNQDYVLQLNCSYIGEFNGTSYDTVKMILMQYVGLKDHCGNDVYEGDLLSMKWKAEVYISNEGTYMVKFHTNPEHNADMTLLSFSKMRRRADCPEDFEVIGNIHEHKHLLQ